jgi:multiple sugar transport system ATP-binding protein
MATFGPVAAVSINVAAGSTTMVALVEPTVSAKVREELRLPVNPDRLYFFDKQSEATN